MSTIDERGRLVRDAQLRSMPPIDISEALDTTREKGESESHSLASLSIPHESRGLDKPNITFHRQTAFARNHGWDPNWNPAYAILKSQFFSQCMQRRCRNRRNDSTNRKESARETEN